MFYIETKLFSSEAVETYYIELGKDPISLVQKVKESMTNVHKN